MRLYEQAIQAAREHGFLQHEALAFEVAARFYAARGLETIAQAYLRAARRGYLRWGAEGKIRQLEQLHPHLRETSVLSPSRASVGAPIGQLDAETVLKASQALSGEILLPELIRKLMRITLEHAGAERGLLVLPRAEELKIQAAAVTGHDGVEVAVSEVEVTAADLPLSMLHYVMRTREGVVLDDASIPNPYREDGYVQRNGVRSVLCLPIVNQANLVGALYLENTLTPHAFTADRVAVLKMLASQAAISLENARLFADVQRAQADLAHASRVNTMGELTAALAHEVNQPITATVANANAALRFLSGETPNLEEAREAATAIIRAGERAADIVGRTRDLFKKRVPQPEPLDVDELLRGTLVLLESEARRHAISIDMRLAAGSIAVMGDRIQLQQVIMNLVVNGIEAMKDAEGASKLAIRSRAADDGRIEVSISDTGVGLPAQGADRIFETFFTTKADGTGMGLSICRSIVEAHGGRLWAEPNTPRGAIFQFTLPVAAET
jgi:C4-dicarboxylate-specific signal transduction histidine kinase